MRGPSFFFSSLCFFFTLALHGVIPNTQAQVWKEHAALPPRGWNSYDSFCWTISEEEFLQNAQLVAEKLHAYGYEYVVVDYLWYRRKVDGANVDSLGFDVIDEWGRPMPDPDRWPSSRGGKGFTEVANRVHSMGLKFGIHVMRGISTQAFNANTSIMDTTTGKAYEEAGRQWHARDIGIKEKVCGWMKNGFMSVHTKSGAGRAFLRSLYQQYADWGVDFVKHDCVFGGDLDKNEISFVSSVLTELNRPILYSLSPGRSATPDLAREVSGLVNMYRITDDDWDNWNDVSFHFDVTRDFAAENMIGDKGLLGKSWPDSDMLPLGWLTDPGSNEGPHRSSRLSLDEQRTQVTLWSMAKSPFMFGGDMRNLDSTTFSLISNPVLLGINAFSSNNKEFPYVTGSQSLWRRDLALKSQLTNQKIVGTAEASVLRFHRCENIKAKGWSGTTTQDDDAEQVCWKGNLGSQHQAPFCLYKKTRLLASDEEVTYNHQDNKRHQLVSTENTELCLDASPSRRLEYKELKQESLSPCRPGITQLWELNHNGTLLSSYSGLCASVRTVKAVSKGVRSWIATGPRGEMYIAFFNLNNVKTTISANISDLAKALPGKISSNALCMGKEVWTEKDTGVISRSLSVSVETHGCALFVLLCR